MQISSLHQRPTAHPTNNPLKFLTILLLPLILSLTIHLSSDFPTAFILPFQTSRQKQTSTKSPFTLREWEIPPKAPNTIVPSARAFHFHTQFDFRGGAFLADEEELIETISWFHGGLGPDGPLNDLWAYNPGYRGATKVQPNTTLHPSEEDSVVKGVRGEWEPLLPDNNTKLPPPRYGHVGAVRTFYNESLPGQSKISYFMYIWGGKGGYGKDNDRFLTDMWAADINIDRLTWKKVTQTGRIPTPRVFAAGGGFVSSNENSSDFTFISLSHGLGPDGPLADTYLGAFDYKNPYIVHWRFVNGPWSQYNPWRPHGNMLAGSYTSPLGKHYMVGGCYGTNWTGGNCPSQDVWMLQYNQLQEQVDTNVVPTATPLPDRKISAKKKADGLPIDVWRKLRRGPSPRLMPALARGLYSFGGGKQEAESLVAYCGRHDHDSLVTDQIIEIDKMDCLELHIQSFLQGEKWRTVKLDYIGVDKSKRERAIAPRVGLTIAPFSPYRSSENEGNKVFTGRERYLVFGGRDAKGEFYNDTYVIEFNPTIATPRSFDDRESNWWSYPQVHGIFMFMAFGLLFPFGAIVSRYYKKRHLWIKFHVVSQLTGLVFAIIGLVLIVHSRMGKIVHIAHAYIGLILISILFLQVLMAGITKIIKKIFIPIDYSSRRFSSAEQQSNFDPAIDGVLAKWMRIWKPFHRLLGWNLVALGAVNVTLGMFLLTLPFIVWMHWVVGMAIVVLILIICEIASVGRAARKADYNDVPDPTAVDVEM